MLTQMILVLLAIPVILTLYFQLQKFKQPKNTSPPGPKGLPLIGNLLQFDAKNPHMYLWHLSQKFGPIVFLKLGFRKVIVISSANIVKEIMKSHDINFSGRPEQRSTQKLSYGCQDIAFSTYNEAWREARKLCILHLFSLKQVQSYSHVHEEEVSRMVTKIKKNFDLSNVNNLSEMVISMFSNIICRTAFGKSYGDENYDGGRFTNLVNEAQAMFLAFFVSDYLPSLRWIDNITGLVARLDKCFKNMDSFYQELIDEHLNNASGQKSTSKHILALLLQLKKDESASIDLTFDRIKAILMNILIGGVDTSSSFLIWGMTYLMTNQTAMKKVQAEIRDYAGNKGFIDGDDVHKLPYLMAVIKETFRIYPPLPLLVSRETLKDCTLNGYEIERGTMVYINAWAIGRDPDVWENPNEFLPERFLEMNIEMKGLNPELIPFGIGRRGCPGYSLGMATLEVALANLLYKFNWEFPPGVTKKDIDFDVLPGFAMHKKNALCLVAKPVHLN